MDPRPEEAPVEPVTPAAPPSRLFGRDRELARLRELVDQVPFVMVLGLGGSGKTALIRAALTGRTVVEWPVEPGFAERLDNLGAVWLVDDAHRLATDAIQRLAETAERLRHGRIVCAARQVISVRERGPERGELQLGPIDVDAGLELWRWLDAVRGPRPGFAAAWTRCGGNPLQLRRAHEGFRDACDPIAGLVEWLSPEERAVIAALALAPEGALPLESLRAGLQGGVTQSIERLVMVLLVSIDAAGVARLDPAARQAARDAMEPTALAELLERMAGELARHPQALLSAAASIPVARRSPTLRLRLAHARRRMLALHEAVVELGTANDAESLHERAHLALRLARLDEAERLARLALAAPDCDAGAALRTCLDLAQALAHQGRVLEAHTLLDEAAPAGGAAVPLAAISLARAFIEWCDSETPPPPDAVAGSLAVLAAAGASFELPGLPALILQPTGAGARDREEATYARAREAWAALAAGRYHDAAETFADAASTLEQGGDLLGARWLRVDRARALLAAGHARQAWSLLDDLTAAGPASIVARAARSRRLDPRAQLETLSAEPGPLRITDARRDALAALTALIASRPLEAGTLAERCTRLAGRDHAVERMLAAVVRAGLARLAGDARAHEDAIGAARHEAAGEGIDADLLAAAVAWVRGRRIIRRDGPALLKPSEQPTFPPGAVVVDAATKELRHDGRALSLGRRSIVRRLLLALCERCGRIVTRDELARELWGRPYESRLHDNSLKVNVYHLRGALRGTGIEIVTDHPGYRLEVPASFIFLPVD